MGEHPKNTALPEEHDPYTHYRPCPGCMSKVESERDALKAELSQEQARSRRYRETMERGIELNCHPQSCRWFCDKNQPCDCFISIASSALADNEQEAGKGD